MSIGMSNLNILTQLLVAHCTRHQVANIASEFAESDKWNYGSVSERNATSLYPQGS